MIIRTSPEQCHVSSVPVFNSMRQPEVKPWGGVVTAAMVIALVVYMGTGECSPPVARLRVLPLPPVSKVSGPAFLGMLCILNPESTSVDMDLNWAARGCSSARWVCCQLTGPKLTLGDYQKAFPLQGCCRNTWNWPQLWWD